MSEVPADEPKPPQVISLATRQAYEAPPPKRRTRRGKVDKLSLESLEDVVGRVKAGELVGVCILAFDRKTKIPTTFVHFDPAGDVQAEAVRAIGGCSMMQDALQDIAVFGLEAMSDEDEDEMVLGPEDWSS